MLAKSIMSKLVISSTRLLNGTLKYHLACQHDKSQVMGCQVLLSTSFWKSLFDRNGFAVIDLSQEISHRWQVHDQRSDVGIQNGIGQLFSIFNNGWVIGFNYLFFSYLCLWHHLNYMNSINQTK